MSELSEVFKNQLRKKSEELDYPSSSNFLNLISEELKTEQENDKLFQFKKKLSQSSKVTKDKISENLIDIFSGISSEPENIPVIQNEIIEEIESKIPQILEEDFISNIVNTITKEELNKPVQENINLFSQPEIQKTDSSIKALQDKVKMLEEWLSKISMTGPGGGAGDAISLTYPITEVDSDYTMNRKDYCLLVNPSVKTYINLPPAYDERRVIIKDISGHANLTPIHINGTIDGDVNGAEIRVKFAALQLIYKNNSWWII